jgi:hypothetical protein
VVIFARKRRALTASAARARRKDASGESLSSRPWQEKALGYYDKIGELRYASQFYARQLSRIRIYPATLQPDGSTQPIEGGPPVDLLNHIQDPGGGRSRLLYDYGRLMFVTGEGFLFGDMLETDEERWRFLWKEELKIDDQGQAVRIKQDKKETSEVGIAYRCWTPHPRHSDESDSPMRAVLNIAEELLLLTAAVRATAVSRLTNGMLILPSELNFAPDEAGGDEDPEQNVFLSKMAAHFLSQIENPGAPESNVPYLLEASSDYIGPDMVRWLKLHDAETDYLEKDLRVEAIKRMALGLDMPPEVLLGMTDANHWTAKSVQHDMWRSHGVSKAEQFCDDINNAYLRPALIEAEFADAKNVVIAFDDSQVVVSPDRSADALEVFKVGGLSWKALREQTGFTEDEAPSEDELAKIAAIITRNQGLIQEEFDLEPAPAPGAPGPVPTAGRNGDASDGPPQPTRGRAVSRQEARTASIMGAAAMALRNCRVRAGIRLRSGLSDTCPECRERTEEVPASMVASAIGLELLEEMGKRDPMALVGGGAEEFSSMLEEWGIDSLQAAALCQRIEAYAAKTLFEEQQPDLPPGFISQVEELDAVD